MNQPSQKMNVDFTQTTAEVCESCGHDLFIPAFKMRKLSALLAPTGQPTMIPVQVFSCAKCGHINDVFLPKNERLEQKK